MPGILGLRKYFQGSPSLVTHSLTQQTFFKYFYVLAPSACVNSRSAPWPGRPPEGTVTLLKIPGKSGVEVGVRTAGDFIYKLNSASSRPTQLFFHTITILRFPFFVPSVHITHPQGLTAQQTVSTWGTSCLPSSSPHPHQHDQQELSLSWEAGDNYPSPEGEDVPKGPRRQAGNPSRSPWLAGLGQTQRTAS